MSVTSRVIPAPPEAVADVLSNGWCYALWVVGTTHIRDVDAAWPAPGSRVHHSVGAWPAMLSDSTEVVESDLPRRLVLQAHGQALGSAYVRLDLEPTDGGTRVTITERPTTGPGRWLDNPALEWMLHRRNVEGLARLESLVRHGAARTLSGSSPAVGAQTN